MVAEDGVCLQTSESIGCAEELGLPVVVVLNKIDLLGEKDAAKVLGISRLNGTFTETRNPQPRFNRISFGVIR